MADDGTDLESAPYLLHQVNCHLLWVACYDEILEILEERRREVLGEDPLFAEAPQVELESLGFDQTSSRSAAENPCSERGDRGANTRRTTNRA